MALRVGDEAPAFSLDGMATDGSRRTYELDDYRGTPLVLVFYPADNTPVCTVQLTRYTEAFPSFEGSGAEVLAISPQTVDSHESFSARNGGFAFPLLADLDKEVGRRYGVVGPLGFYRRSAFVIDRQGRVRWLNRSITGLSFPSSSDLVDAVEAAR